MNVSGLQRVSVPELPVCCFTASSMMQPRALPHNCNAILLVFSVVMGEDSSELKPKVGCHNTQHTTTTLIVYRFFLLFPVFAMRFERVTSGPMGGRKEGGRAPKGRNFSYTSFDIFKIVFLCVGGGSSCQILYGVSLQLLTDPYVAC